MKTYTFYMKDGSVRQQEGSDLGAAMKNEGFDMDEIENIQRWEVTDNENEFDLA